MELRNTRRRKLPNGGQRQLYACCLSLLVSLFVCRFMLPWVPNYAMTAQWPPDPVATIDLPPPHLQEAIVRNALHVQPTGLDTLATLTLTVDEPMSIPAQLVAMSSPKPEVVKAIAPAEADSPLISVPTKPQPSAPLSATLSEPADTTFSDAVRKGDTAILILERAGVDGTQAMALYRAVRKLYNLRHINVGNAYHVSLDDTGQMQQFIYEIDHQRRLEVKRSGQNFLGEIKTIPFERHERLIVGELSDSIYATLRAQGESTRLIHDFADIFAWSVDFATDLRQGDSFRLLIEEHLRKGQPAEYHRILAAELVNQNRKLQSIYYTHNNIGSYYRPDGRSMQGMFLRSPLRYTRISSHFTKRRFHPILKRYSPHLGVDYAAPRGTPVRSVAEGHVDWIGRKGANGKMIVIRHHNGYKSYYLHLSRYAPGLRRAKRVTQGQIIGYVGSTGRSTGPHLDFRLAKNGTYLNPLRHRSVEGPSMPKGAMAHFRKHAETMLTKLSQVQLAMQQAPTSGRPNPTQ